MQKESFNRQPQLFKGLSLQDRTASLLCYSRGTRKDTGLCPEECDLHVERLETVTQEE